MGKHRSPANSQGKHEKKIKRKDSSDLGEISPEILLKFESIIKNQPILRLEKISLNDSVKYPNTLNSHVTSISKTRDNAPHGPKKILSSKLVSQASKKKIKIYWSNKPSSSASKCRDSSRRQNYLERSHSVNSSFVSTEGSLDEEFSKYGGGFGKSRSSGNVKIINCTRDPNRVTPCSDTCCIQFSNSEDEKKKSKKRDKDSGSSSKKPLKSQPTFNTSIKTKPHASQKSTDSTFKRKRSKDEKSKKKESDAKNDNNLLSSQDDIQASSSTPNRLAVFTKKMMTPESSPTPSTSKSCGLNFYLGPPNSSTHLLANRGVKRSEFFPDFPTGNSCKSETRTNHPKVVIPKKTQAQMLEAATFPKTRGPNIDTFTNTKLSYTQSNIMSYVSPLSYQENEFKVTQSVNRLEGYSKTRENVLPQQSFSGQNEITNFSYPENNFLMKDPVDNRNAINAFEDSFRNSAFQRIPQSGPPLSEMRLDENICNFPPNNNQRSANGFHLGREEPLFGSQLSYADSHVNESSLSNMEKGEFLFQDLQIPEAAFNKIMNTIDTSIAMPSSETNDLAATAVSQKKNIKIKEIETIPSSCITVLRRQKAAIKTENHNESVANVTVCEQERVAVINMQNLEQLRKEEIAHNQELYDYNIIGEELITTFLPSSHDENALDENALDNASIKDFLDDFLGGDIVNNNNNEKIHPHPNEHNTENAFDVKNEPPPASTEMLQLYDPSGRSCVVPITEDNNMSKFNEFLDETNQVQSNYIDENVEDKNEHFEFNNSICEFKEPVQNFLNSCNERPMINTEDVCPRKRKWLNESQQSQSEPAKKIKLKRRKWSRIHNDGDDVTTDTSSEVSSSCLSSFCDNDGSYQNPSETFITFPTNHDEIVDKPQLTVDSSVVDEPQIETKFENPTNPEFMANDKPELIRQLEMYHEPEVHHELETNHNSEVNHVLELNPEIKTQIEPETVAVEESRDDPDPQPEPERDNNLTMKLSPPYPRKKIANPESRKKKRKRNSKFSPNSRSSDSSSDDEFKFNGSSSSDNERDLKDKCILLKRFQQDLSDIQSETNKIDNDKASFKAPSSPNKDEQKEDDVLSLCASPSLMDISSRCGTPSLEIRATPSDVSTADEFNWDTYKRKNDVELACDLRLYLERNQNERRKNEQNELKQEDLFTKPIKSAGNLKLNSNPRVNDVKSRLELSSNSNKEIQKTNNNVRHKIEAPSATDDKPQVNIVKSNIEKATTSNVNNVTSKNEIPSSHNAHAINFATKIDAPSTSNGVMGSLDQAQNLAKRPFLGICYIFLSNGKCFKHGCFYEHKIPENLINFENISEVALFGMMCLSIRKKFRNYLFLTYERALKKFNYILAMQFFSDIMNLNMITTQQLVKTVEILCQKAIPFSKVIQAISECLPMGHVLLPVLLNIIDQKSPRNEYWESIRCLIWKQVLTEKMLEQILHQCLNETKNMQRMNEVHETFIKRRYNEKVRQDLWAGFYNALHVRLNENSENQENLPVNIDEPMNIVNDGIESPDPMYRSPVHNIPETDAFENNLHEPATCNYENNAQNRVESIPAIIQDPVFNLENDNQHPDAANQNEVEANTYSVKLIADLPPPGTAHRDNGNLWKFFDRLESLKRGLRHKDYTHVVNIIKLYMNGDKSFFTRHCYRALCEEVIKCKTHVDNIIKVTVQDGELSKMREILSRIGTCVLIELADRGLWVYANELLKTLQKYELYNNNAGLTLLAAEIYLANHLLTEAFWLLRESNIIFTNCAMWKVKSTKEDMELRVSVVTLLLEALCQNHAQEAFFAFDLILGEQQSNVYPINLTRVVDRLMLSLLAQDRLDSVINLCKKALRYHLNFHEITYRTVITALVPVDIDLARQFFQYATYLGVYTAINADLVTCVITNIDWSEEEMYLVISEFLRKLSLGAGFAISHIGIRQLSASFLLEAVPSRKQLFNNIADRHSKENDKRIKQSKAMLKNILETRFDPPITIVKREQGKICKINGQSLVAYLKAGHFNI